METTRVFLAIPLPTELQQRLSRLQQRLKLAIPELRTAAPHNLHLSLIFLGDQPREMLDKIVSLMQSIGISSSSFSLRLNSVGCFPTAKQPRVVWMGVEQHPQLLQLQADLVDGLCGLGLPREARPYRPHLTLGRFRRPPLSQVSKEFSEFDGGHFEVTSMVLYSSRLTPQGALHHPLHKVKLTGAKHQLGPL